MFSKFRVKIAALMILALVLIVAGCSSGTSGTTTTQTGAAAVGGRIKATWITPKVVLDTVSVPAQVINQDTIVHFWVTIPEGQMPFMAYKLDNKQYVRANLCVPCRSYNYSLVGDVLQCDTCGTRFNAKTGDGIDGACVNYPKALVPYTNQGGDLAMTVADAKTSYFNTLEPGWP
ncbi:putative membrane protein (DUF2318) [Dehalogenimonas alkenigignens]|uniref:Putative membrane protein (DUF2318) n=1 Tax=Dehalogenimonas alkenigignens TaxID=1217799 RepID=A0A0W0GL73_9CHLR|nr:Fe-S-containing protein [Dehalogenimonas alkenigignens]KTB49288.1 putative membrane protein (DUF2318) [Dehalogenimonas alkenigignens]